MPPSTCHNESVAMTQVSRPEAFADLADRSGNRSLMMRGSLKTYAFDAARGRAIVSMIGIGESILGLKLYQGGVVTARTSPSRKRWGVCGPQQILEIKNYLMGFETRPIGDRSQIRGFIDYQLPHHIFGRLLGRLFALLYARQRVWRMVKDAAMRFRSNPRPWIAA